MTPGMKFRGALAQEKPLQLVGTLNAYTALLAQRAGFQALYLSGAGVANASYGKPDLGFTTLENVLEDTQRITHNIDLPLLVDIDTGFDNITHTLRAIEGAQAAGIHIEDQISAKRCGHRPGKRLVSTSEMVARLTEALDARVDTSFIIMARTDALSVEGFDAAVERAMNYVEAGADMIFFEGAQELSQYQQLTRLCPVPVLANITEFGMTPLFTKEELSDVGVSLILYPLSAFRAMSFAAANVYQTIRAQGTQKYLLDQMQTRDELYEVLNYHSYEKQLDDSLNKGNNNE